MAETGGRPVLAVDPSTLSLSHKTISATDLGISQRNQVVTIFTITEDH